MGGVTVKRAVLYLRVSTVDQTTANQERELREVASRIGCEIVKVYKDHGISGAKGREKRPDFDALCKAATRREFDMVMAWSVDRLGRSLQDLIGFLSELHALSIRHDRSSDARSARAISLHSGLEQGVPSIRLPFAAPTCQRLSIPPAAVQACGLAQLPLLGKPELIGRRHCDQA